MGNRAVIAFNDAKSSPCIYLHWNGGRASVEAFMQAANHVGIVHTTDVETMDAIAELIARHFFDVKVGALNVYREKFGTSDTDNGDNGAYIIRRDNFEIERRLHADRTLREETNPEKTREMVAAILKSVRDAARAEVAT